MKKRMMCFSLMVILSLIMSGCAGISESLENKMVEKAGIVENSEYQTYQTYSSAGKLTSDGYYSDEVFEAESAADDRPENSVLVSFSSNNYLDVKFYADAIFSKEITEQACYLSAGEQIFATAQVSNEVPSSMYAFAGFRLYRFEDGKRELVSTIMPEENGFVLEIDDSMVDGDYSIEPIGDYGSRKISLRDYYTDDDGNEQNLAGKWLIDDKEITGDELEINPVASYIISYEYNNDEYFYLSSIPECYYGSHEDGIVIFELMNPTDESYDYSVELHKYISVNLETSVDRTITMNGGSPQSIKAGQKFPVNKLKYGDEVTLLTNKEWPQLEACRELIVTSIEKMSYGQFEYTMIVPQKGGEFIFDPSAYSYAHGTIVFKCFGEIVTNPLYLAKGTIISYSAGTTEPGYWLPDGNHTIKVGEEEETRAALNSISFIPEVKAEISLPQPEYGGKIKYFVDGREIKTTTYKTPSGTVITMKFEPWPGWITNYTNGESYRVTDALTQVVKIRSNAIDSAFKEDEGHKPTLEVVLDKSVGESMKFSVSASGLPVTNCQYEGNWTGSSKVVVEPTKIGTEEGIQLTLGNRSLQANTAVKILVERKDTNGNKTSDYYLVNNLAEKMAPIAIYTQRELGISTVWYETIKISISVVSVQTFNTPSNPAHASVTVRVTDTQKVLKAGDLVEPSEEVTVTITPHSNYYVTGKNVKNDIYQEKMKFSKYQKDINTIIAEHPIEKYVQLTLGANDPYGTCIYTVGKNTVSGSIRLKIGEKLTLKYTVTSSGYVIEGGSNGILGIGKTTKELSETITITSDWDGKTISKADFGINVEKEE